MSSIENDDASAGPDAHWMVFSAFEVNIGGVSMTKAAKEPYVRTERVKSVHILLFSLDEWWENKRKYIDGKYLKFISYERDNIVYILTLSPPM